MPNVYLIPAPLHEEGLDQLPAMLLPVIERCSVFFVENERTARRYLKALWKEFRPGEDFEIDKYEWVVINEQATGIFRQHIKVGKDAGIISEAGCPGIADPGQSLVAIAHELNATVRPVSGPSSLILALMASGMNGQHFNFNGYLPVKNGQREKAIRELEAESARKKCTQVFIETPYRNNILLQAFLHTCKPQTRLCVAINLAAPDEWVKTKTIDAWKKDQPDLQKQPAVFLLDATIHP